MLNILARTELQTSQDRELERLGYRSEQFYTTGLAAGGRRLCGFVVFDYLSRVHDTGPLARSVSGPLLHGKQC